MITKITKISVVTFLSIIIFGLLGLTAFKRSSNYVDLSKKENGVIFFYKDDCPDCNEIFNQVVLKKVTGSDITFVNLNNPKNANYITKYFLSSVPTFTRVKNGEIQKVYSGTSFNGVKKILKE